MSATKQNKQTEASTKPKRQKDKVQEEDNMATERGIPDVDFKKFLGCGG